MLSIDFETRSPENLRGSGAHRYSEHPETEIACLGYAFNDEPADILYPPFDLTKSYRLLDHVAANKPVRAWNASFEYQIWNNVLIKKYPPFNINRVMLNHEQLYDTMADALCSSLPGSLKEAAIVLNCDHEKLAMGRGLLAKLNKNKELTNYELQELYAYCMEDVEVEREIAGMIPPMSDMERAIYLLTVAMNDRGVDLDKELIVRCQTRLKKFIIDKNNRLAQITNGEVTKATQVQKLLKWLQNCNIDIENLQIATVKEHLEEDHHPLVLEVLKIRQMIARSSTAKLARMLQVIGPKRTARGLFQYYGATTGRWAGRLIQPQNLPRPDEKPKKALVKLVTNKEVPKAVSNLLRYMFVARPGKVFYAGDFSQIEARVLAWLAGQDDLVYEFAKGSKIYEQMASDIYRVPLDKVTSEQRFIGKNAILGAGYQMGAPRFQEQVKQQAGVILDPSMARRSIKTYRTKYRKIPILWDALNRNAQKAIANPKHIFSLPRSNVAFMYTNETLYMKLPSGRWLVYHEPKIYRKHTPFKHDAIKYKGVGLNKKFVYQDTYGGRLTENLVQATARDALAEAMLRLEAYGYKVVLTIHDEIVAEVDKDDAKYNLEHFLRLMAKVPRWAEGLPLAVEGWKGERYRK